MYGTHSFAKDFIKGSSYEGRLNRLAINLDFEMVAKQELVEVQRIVKDMNYSDLDPPDPQMNGE